MKKLYTLILSLFLFSGATKAQLTLTQSANEPVIGNLNDVKSFDSTTVLDRNSGSGQTWNFTTLTSNTMAVVTNSYLVKTAVTGYTAYPAATVAQTDGTNNTFFKSTTNLFEMLGLKTSSATLNFTNTAIVAAWPIAFGYSNNDPVSGTLSTSYGNGTFSGNLVTTAPGTGTLQLPNSMTYTNVLQVLSRLTANAVVTTSLGSLTATLTVINYQYYNSIQKFPLLTVSTNILDIQLFGSQEVTTININNLLFAGINELNFDNAYSVYPNPTSGVFNIALTNIKTENVSVEILNQFGQSLKKENLGNATNINSTINTSGFNSGVYFVRTTMGNKTSVKKLIIE